MRNSTIVRGVGALSTTLIGMLSATAVAAEIIGQPIAGKTGFQPASSPVAEDLQWLDGMMTVIMSAIVIFVTVLLLYVIFRFRASANPTPARFSHNRPLELAWTLIPVLILVIIGSFSLPTLLKELEIPKGDINIKVTGNQWFWSYEYIGQDIAFDSFMIGAPATVEGDEKAYILDAAMEAKLKKAGYTKEQWLLAVDNPLVVPVGATVVLNITGADVIHSWALPAFGVKQDAVPGRLAQAWFKAEKVGTYFGQCSELCGKDHSFMPIEVKVLSPADYQAWLVKAKQQFADAGATPSTNPGDGGHKPAIRVALNQ